jgi:hypothetical protein
MPERFKSILRTRAQFLRYWYGKDPDPSCPIPHGRNIAGD